MSFEQQERAHYIEKAKRERGLTEEQIAYFLERCKDYKLLPYFCTHVKRDPDRNLQAAVDWVLEMLPDTAVM